jgi:hypothetical protein
MPFSISEFPFAVLLATSGDGFRIMTPHAGWAVAASWLTLIMNRRWRPERDWIDRAGRVVGIAWIAPIPFYSWVVIHRL